MKKIFSFILFFIFISLYFSAFALNDKFQLYKENNKFGVKDVYNSKNIIVPPKFDGINYCSDENFIVTVNGKKGLFHSKNGIMYMTYDPIYKNIKCYGKDSAVVFQINENNYQAIDVQNGKVIINRADEIYRGYSPYLFRVKKDGKYGIVNYQNKKVDIILPYKYDEIDIDFPNNIQRVKKLNKFAIVDIASGSNITPFIYDDIKRLDRRYFKLGIKGKYALYDQEKNTISEHKYDDIYLYASTGPRYIWSTGDVWAAAVASRRWYGWDAYNWSAGARLGINYDFTRRLSGGLSVQYTNNQYDYYGEYLDGDTYSVLAHLFYPITSNMYAILRGGIVREGTVAETYSYWQPNVSIGFGAEMPYGFNIYIEPMFYWQNYDGEQFTIQNDWPTFMTERDFIQRYSVSLSNNKLDIFGFVPVLVFSYTRRDSNMWQREYDRWAIEFTMQQRF